MRIRIENEGRKFVIPIPNCIFLSSFGVAFLKKSTPKNIDVDFSSIKVKDMRKLRRCIRKMRRLHKNWYLVDVQDSDGNSVRMKL